MVNSLYSLWLYNLEPCLPAHFLQLHHFSFTSIYPCLSNFTRTSHSLSLEKVERNRRSDGTVSNRVHVQSISRIKRGQQTSHVCRIPHGRIKVEYTVEYGVSPDPAVNLLTTVFPEVSVVVGVVAEGGDCGDVGVLSLGVEASCHLFEPLNESSDRSILGLLVRRGGSDIIDAFEQDGPRDLSLGKNVAVDPTQSVWSKAVSEHTVSSGCLVQDGHGHLCGLESLVELVGPPTEGRSAGMV